MALFDTGATTLVIAGRRPARRRRRRGMKPAGIDATAPAAGPAPAWTAAFDRFELGGEAISNNRLRVADFDIDDADMLLGIDFFLSHHIYVSKQQSRMYFTYNGGPVFALNKAATRPAAAAGDPAPAAATAADDGRPARAARRGLRPRAATSRSALADLDRACALDPTTAALLRAARRHARAAEAAGQGAGRPRPGAARSTRTQADARLSRAALRTARRIAKARRPTSTRSIARSPPQAQMRLGDGAACISRSISRRRRWRSSTSGCPRIRTRSRRTTR